MLQIYLITTHIRKRLCTHSEIIQRTQLPSDIPYTKARRNEHHKFHRANHNERYSRIIQNLMHQKIVRVLTDLCGHRPCGI